MSLFTAAYRQLIVRRENGIEEATSAAITRRYPYIIDDSQTVVGGTGWRPVGHGEKCNIYSFSVSYRAHGGTLYVMLLPTCYSFISSCRRRYGDAYDKSDTEAASVSFARLRLYLRRTAQRLNN